MDWQLLQADARAIPLADGCVHCVVTSPPYWGLRDYGVDGQIGLEPTPDAFVETMVQVFREVRRVLRDDGTCWVNLGDSYNAHPGQRKTTDKAGPKQRSDRGSIGAPSRCVNALKPKDLIGIPWRVALALQADGWWLRSDCIWSKSNPMPESVTDRPTKSHEYVFLLTKRERYFYDAEAAKESAIHAGRTISLGEKSMSRGQANGANVAASGNGKAESYVVVDGRNLRTVWTIPKAPYPGAHFATFPPALPEKCINLGTSEAGSCASCGKPWERVVDSERVATRPGNNSKVYVDPDGSPYQQHSGTIIGNRDPMRHTTQKRTRGFQPACECGAPAVPCLVLDPFNGSGTTGMVARQLGRRYVGLDLSTDYLDLATKRIRDAFAAASRDTVKSVKPSQGQPSLFALP